MNRKDLVASAILLAIAGAYYLASRPIPITTLEDQVGPRGLPDVLSAALALLAIGIGVRAFVVAPERARGPAAESEAEAPWPRALGMLALGALYVPLASVAGYFATLFVLLVAVGVYEGLRPSWRLIAIAFFGAGFFWLLFAEILGVRQPSGVLF
jgi:putative tricarboxylic transport membrane protein